MAVNAIFVDEIIDRNYIRLGPVDARQMAHLPGLERPG